MKILFCIGSLSKGGAERVISNLTNFLSNENDICIIATRITNIVYDLDEKIRVISLENNNKCNNFFIKNIRRLIMLKKHIGNIKPDIIISFLPEPSYRVLLIKKIFYRRIPIIVSVRNDPKIEYKSIINKIVMKLLYPIADGFVFQTKEAQKYFNKKIQNKSIIIPNPLSEEFIVDSYTGEREKNIVTVGRLAKQKNHKMLIEAFSKIQNKIKPYKLIIYGEGTEKNNLQELIDELKLQDYVILAGQVDDVKNAIYKSSMFVLSSDYEGLPNALLEAIGLGIPCVSTDCPCGGPREIREKGIHIFLTEVGNSDKMAEQILNVIHLKNTDFLNKNKKILQNIFSLKKVNELWHEYIESVKSAKEKK